MASNLDGINLDDMTEEELAAIANALHGELEDSGELFNPDEPRGKVDKSPAGTMEEILSTIENTKDEKLPKMHDKSWYKDFETEAEKKGKYGNIPESYIDNPHIDLERATDYGTPEDIPYEEPAGIEVEKLLSQFDNPKSTPAVEKKKVEVKPIGKKGLEVKSTSVAAKKEENPLAKGAIEGSFPLPKHLADMKPPKAVPMTYSEKAKSQKEIMRDKGVEESGTDFLPGGESESLGSLLATIAAGAGAGILGKVGGSAIEKLFGRGGSEAAKDVMSIGGKEFPASVSKVISKPTSIPSTTSRYNTILGEAGIDPLEAVGYSGKKALFNPMGHSGRPLPPVSKSKAENALSIINDRIKKGTIRKDAVVIQLNKMGLPEEAIQQITSKLGSEPVRSILGGR